MCVFNVQRDRFGDFFCLCKDTGKGNEHLLYIVPPNQQGKQHLKFKKNRVKMTSPDLPEGSGASHSSEDWMKVLDRFLESGSGENGVAGSNAAGAGGESCDDLFLFAQLDGSLFQDTDTNLINPLQFYNQSSPRVGSVIVNNNTATTTISRNRSSSISLTSLIQNTYTNNVSIPMSTNHDHDHHPRQETKISENWMSNFRANIQNHGTSHEHENRHSSMHEIHPQLSYTTTQLPMNKRSKVDTATAASHEDEATADDDDNDLDEEADDPEDTNSFTTDSELKNQQSKYERKRTLERRRRLDTKSQFDALAVTLLEIEQEFLIQEDPDEEEVGSGHNSKQKDTSSSSSSISKRPKNGPPATCFKTTTNRLDLISRAIVALQRLQDNVHSLKKDKKALKKVIYKLNALSTDHIHPIPSSSSCNHHSRPITTATTASISSVITVPQPSCATSQSQTLVNGLAPSCSIQGAGTVPFHRAAAAAASSAVADATVGFLKASLSIFITLSTLKMSLLTFVTRLFINVVCVIAAYSIHTYDAYNANDDVPLQSSSFVFTRGSISFLIYANPSTKLSTAPEP